MTGPYQQLLNDLANEAALNALAKSGVQNPTTQQLHDATRCAKRHLLPVLQIEQPDLFTGLLHELRAQHAAAHA